MTERMARVMFHLCKSLAFHELERILLGYYDAVIGIDEAGTGALFGPVVAVAARYDPAVVCENVRDSKLMKSKEIEEAYRFLSTRVEFGVGVVSATEINTLLHNVKEAGFVARSRAFESLLSLFKEKKKKFKRIVAVVDHFPLAVPGVDCLSVTHGDRVVYSVAVASVLAKYTRDTIVVSLAKEHPEWAPYEIESNKGYRSPSHLFAIATHGPTPEHRLHLREVKRAAEMVEVRLHERKT